MLDAWGKARPRSDGPQWHPAAYHCLDVAACAKELLDRLPLIRQRLAELLDTPDPAPLVVGLIALHDTGKFSRAFQCKVPAHWPAGYGDIADAPADPGHATTGMRLWVDRISQSFPDGKFIRPLARATFGHHGQPVTEDRIDLANYYGSAGLAYTEQFASEIVALFQPSTVGDNGDLERASWLVAGLAVLSDWIGSGRHFHYHSPTLPLVRYWSEIALPRAADAVADAGVTPVVTAPERTYSALTGIDGWQPTPMQQWASETDPAPGLYVIEDSTGAGKTEAALMLAHRLIAAGHAAGIYVALPTMATADGMFDRVSTIYRRLFSDDTPPSIALAHGARDLHEQFQTAILDPSSDSYCAQWIADDRRKTFLAQIGVGTIDQALLGVLPSSHQSLRVLGLAQRVLILDEVHAYDGYMSQEIEALLAMQHALGGSTILLSATLPADAKRRLMARYGGTATDFSAAYPLATMQTAAGLKETPINPRPINVRDVPAQFVATPMAGLARVIDAARQGQAVLYIRNTVDEARETFEALPDDINATLFHARFAMCDRLEIQGDALRRFGMPGHNRAHVLIATQVVEQSLDLDFDLVVSDLAPIDLLIQRAGRLWRHERERPPSAIRELVVVSPDPIADADSSWLSSVMRGSSYVYPDHARMWLTADVLRRAGMISAPEGLRGLIEHVYGHGAEDRIPAGLVPSLITAEGRDSAERGAARGSVLRVSDGYARTGPWEDEERARTRLETSPSVTLRLARMKGESLAPWAAHLDPRRAWALSEIRVPKHRAGDLVAPPASAAALSAATESWSEWQRMNVPVVVVQDHGQTHTGCWYDSARGWIGSNYPGGGT